MAEELLGQLLVREGLIDEGQLSRARVRAQSTGRTIVSQLAELGFVDEYEVVRVAADACRLDWVELATSEPPSEDARECIPFEIAQAHRCIPLWLDEDTLTVGVSNPLDLEVEHQLLSRTPYAIRRVVIRDSSVQTLLEQLYASGHATGVYDKILSEGGEERARQLVKAMLSDAIQAGGDIHIMPVDGAWQVCLCVEDDVEDLFRLPAQCYPEVADIFKALLGQQEAEGGEFTLRTGHHEEVTFFLDIDRDHEGEQLFVCLIDRQSVRAPEDVSVVLEFPREMLAELERAAKANNMCIGSLIHKAWMLTRDVVSTACVCPYTNPAQDRNAAKVRLPAETLSDIDLAARTNDRPREWVVMKALLMARECVLRLSKSNAT